MCHMPLRPGVARHGPGPGHGAFRRPSYRTGSGTAARFPTKKSEHSGPGGRSVEITKRSRKEVFHWCVFFSPKSYTVRGAQF